MKNYKINIILHEIRKLCLYSNGCSFEYHYGTFDWHEKYELKKSFFKYRWELTFSSHEEAFNRAKTIYSKETIQECESTLKRLPKGLSYTKKTVFEKQSYITGSWFATNFYKTIYTIQVSEEYIHSIRMSLLKSKAFIDCYCTPDFEEKIYNFKNKVLSQYQNVLKDIKKGYNCVCPSGIGYYDHDYDIGRCIVKIEFYNYELKPLTEEYKLLGLALAIAEQGMKYLKPTEVFTIHNYLLYDYDNSLL